MLVACQNQPGSEGHFYAYTDAQGNLITSDPAVGNQQVETESRPQNGKRTAKAEPAEKLGSDELADYRPSEQVDAEMEARERDRFITYVDESGQLVSRSMDMKAEKDAIAARPEGYQTLAPAPYLETYRAIRADCCQHLLAGAEQIKPGKDKLLAFADESEALAGEQRYRAQVLALAEGVDQVELKAFIRQKGYLSVQLLWLDEQGRPLLLVDQPFSRQYPETWYRYGYLEGTLPREPGQHYLVVFLPYFQDEPATDGLLKVLEGELLLSAS